MTRIAVLGDLPGHLAPFARALGELGVDVAAGQVPDDLVVVQVGDLVHKGPDSDAIVALVDRLLEANPDRYVQLLGNHEDQYLGGQCFYEQTPLAPGTIATLRRWRASGTLRVAAAIQTTNGESYLVTHAGLTRLNFLHHVGVDDVGQAAEVINGMTETRPKVIHATGVMLTDLRSGLAGPLWAEATRELYPGWLRAAATGQPPPFGQIHGHCPLLDFTGQSISPIPADLAKLAVVDQARRHVSVTIGGRRFINLDPGFDDRPPGRVPLHPLVLDGKLLSSH